MAASITTNSDALDAIIEEVAAHDDLDARDLERIVRRHPRPGSGFYSKREILADVRRRAKLPGSRLDLATLTERLRTCPTRSQSGILPVTVLTKPFPCPGRCIFCPNDVRMPKSYIASEPGCQRAEAHGFDPYGQVWSRLAAYDRMGHRLDKVELIVLGGTWSFYPEPYRIWFVTRCLESLSDFATASSGPVPTVQAGWQQLASAHPPATRVGRYNELVIRHARDERLVEERGRAEALATAQERNAGAAVRCVGLSLETRPDHVTEAEVIGLRRLGATKVQLGVQSLSDEVLEQNERGHGVAETRRAIRRLRAAGFKVHAHWMPNLLGSTPDRDAEDFARLFSDPEIRPDELKIYPCSLIEGTALVAHYRAGRWRPYEREELVALLTGCVRRTPRWCRLTRIVRDIPSPEILAGSRETNLREAVDRRLAEEGAPSVDVRAREVRGRLVREAELSLRTTTYETGLGREQFLEFVTPEDRVAAFARLTLPAEPSFVEELGGSALLRELHVYGEVAGLGETAEGRAQHAGLGRRLVEAAAARSAGAGFGSLAVISAVGTRGYYRRLGFRDGPLYQHREVTPVPQVDEVTPVPQVDEVTPVPEVTPGR